jgi:hypothetical protein
MVKFIEVNVMLKGGTKEFKGSFDGDEIVNI